MIFCKPSRFLREIDEKYIDGAKPAPKATSTGWGESGKAIWEPRKPAPPQRVAPVIPDARFKKVATTSARPVDNVLRPTPEGSTFDAGMRVRHAKFGRGTVEDVEVMAGAQSSADLKIVVTFDDPTVGRKTLLSKFAKLEIL
jgi:hypothetical protein